MIGSKIILKQLGLSAWTWASNGGEHRASAANGGEYRASATNGGEYRANASNGVSIGQVRLIG